MSGRILYEPSSGGRDESRPPADGETHWLLAHCSVLKVRATPKRRPPRRGSPRHIIVAPLIRASTDSQLWEEARQGRRPPACCVAPAPTRLGVERPGRAPVCPLEGSCRRCPPARSRRPRPAPVRHPGERPHGPQGAEPPRSTLRSRLPREVVVATRVRPEGPPAESSDPGRRRGRSAPCAPGRSALPPPLRCLSRGTG